MCVVDDKDDDNDPYPLRAEPQNVAVNVHVVDDDYLSLRVLVTMLERIAAGLRVVVALRDSAILRGAHYPDGRPRYVGRPVSAFRSRRCGFPTRTCSLWLEKGWGRRVRAPRYDAAAASRASDRPDWPQHARSDVCR